MIRALVLLGACAALAACEPPPLRIYYQLTDGASQSCGTTKCGEVPMACDAVLNLRILSPNDPSAPYVSICEPVARTSTGLCAIVGIDLDPVDLPRQTLEVQVMVWPRDAVPRDPDTGAFDCRGSEVQFDAASGFPVERGPSHPMPALGGRAFYRPGDEATVVTLGCTDLPSLNTATCVGANTIAVTATVEDFDTLGVTVGSNIGDRLNVDVGEPRENAAGPMIEYELNPGDVRPLPYTNRSPTAWGGPISYTFEQHACLMVLEDGPQSTATVACEPASPSDTTLDLGGVRLAKATLQQILTALQLAAFPDAGLTIGVVLDFLGNPAAGVTVLVGDDAGAIRYLSADRTTFGGTSTSANGIFVSEDAPFGTEFSALGTPTVTGGLISGKVTVVVLRRPPIGG